MKLSCTVVSLAIAVHCTNAFVIPTGKVASSSFGVVTPLFSTPAEEAAAKSAFLPLQTDDDDDDDDEEEDGVDIDTIEGLGRGAAKVSAFRFYSVLCPVTPGGRHVAVDHFHAAFFSHFTFTYILF